MWHMSGHIYSKLHRYADAAWQQEASARVDHAQMMRDGVLPDQIHNYAHNNEWLIRNLAYLGRVDDGIALAKNMISLPRHPKYNTLEKRGTSAAYGHDRLAGVLEQYECWEQVLGAEGRLLWDVDAEDVDKKSDALRMIGLASFGIGNTDQGRRQIAALEKLLEEQRAARVKAADEAEAKARQDKKSEADVAKAMTEALQRQAKPIRKLERTIGVLKALSALASGETAQAKTELDSLKEAEEIRKDHLARLFSLAGDHAEAEKMLRKQVEDGPGQVYPLATLVEVLHRAGKKTEARAEFDKLRPIAAFADLDARVFRRLEPIAGEFGLPERLARFAQPVPWTWDSAPSWPRWGRFAGLRLRRSVGRCREPVVAPCRWTITAENPWS